MAYGIPYTIEGYGIIYNDEIVQRYFALESKGTDFVSMDEIDSFEELRTLVTDMQANAAALGIKGVFAATSLKSGDDWRWTTHLANIPVAYEFDKNNIDLTGDGVKSVSFDYSENFRSLFDLYINNSTVDRKLLGSKITDESMAEFAMGECAMVQNGSWALRARKTRGFALARRISCALILPPLPRNSRQQRTSFSGSIPPIQARIL